MEIENTKSENTTEGGEEVKNEEVGQKEENTNIEEKAGEEKKEVETIPKESYEVVAKKYRESKKQLEELKNQQSKAEEEKLVSQKKYEELYTKQKEKLEKIQNQYANEKKRNALNQIAGKYQVKDNEVIEKLIDLKKIEINEEGEVDTNAIEDSLKSLKKEKSFLFESEIKNNSIGSSGGGSPSGSSEEPTTMKRSELPLDHADWKKLKIHERIKSGSLIIEDDMEA